MVGSVQTVAPVSTEAERELVKAGDALAGMLGVAVAAMDSRELFSPIESDLVRSEILRWHHVKATTSDE
ncbi:MAG: hypothetical protein JO130_18510 [Solirubrobacterales bacterium]|nr:hypothetical protein [Solirubrobacterales bacterium]